MSDLDDLRARIEALEAVVGGVDRNQSDNSAAIQATHHLVQALAITQGQHHEWLQQTRRDLTELRAGQSKIVDLLTQLIDRQ